MKGYQISPRGAGYLFGGDTVTKFVEINKLDCVVRAHQPRFNIFSLLFKFILTNGHFLVKLYIT